MACNKSQYAKLRKKEFIVFMSTIKLFCIHNYTTSLTSVEDLRRG